MGGNHGSSIYRHRDSSGKDARSSGSYEPGSPVILSRVADSLCHAEDVVHELQHHRLLLFAKYRGIYFWY